MKTLELEKTKNISKTEIQAWFENLQDSICHALETTDGGAKFREDKWTRAEGGGGRTRVIANGNILEKGGVAFSAVWGKTPDKILKHLQLDQADFFATGVSLVIHPESPMVPIIHMNVRYFEMSSGVWWFGGGIDLTPHYVNIDDAKYFHQELKKACDKHSPQYYQEYKKWADDYFFIKHRNETRGVGGIFFDRLSEQNGQTKESRFEFVKSVGNAFAPIYTHFMKKNSTIPYSENEKNWQMLRRSRYVEFNLVYDAGTKFGLDTNGRTESILMSMPPQANWEYCHQPEVGSKEANTLEYLKKDITWI
jgi:coproporphyrinogen III oxidase